MTRLRKLLEKSEAARHQSEYSLLLEQKKSRELKDEIADRDDKFSEETQKYKGTFLRFSNAILRSKNTLLLTKPVKVFSLTRSSCLTLTKQPGLLQECQNRAKEWEKAVALAEKAAEMERENMEASFENLKAIISERNGLIEFVTCEAEEKKKQVDDIAKALSTEQTFVNIMISQFHEKLPCIDNEVK